MKIQTPYLLFVGDATDTLSIKMAKGVADWRPDLAVGEFALSGNTASTGLNQMSIQQGKQGGAKSFLLGFANSGGYLEAKYIPFLLEAIESGLDIVSGLHQRLDSFPQIKSHAEKYQVNLIDVRHPDHAFSTGTGIKRKGRRLLTVGTDCSVGKMYSTLSIHKAMKQQGMQSAFKATGQSGIVIEGSGIAIDCVVSDFIAGAVEELSPRIEGNSWDLIEGQGSLFHPAFAGVSMGLIHGAQPDALILCHAEKREHMRGIPGRSLPSIQDTITYNLQAAKLTNPAAQFVGMCVNTSMLTAEKALEVCADYERKYNLTCVDPVRHGVAPIITSLKSFDYDS